MNFSKCYKEIVQGFDTQNLWSVIKIPAVIFLAGGVFLLTGFLVIKSRTILSPQIEVLGESVANNKTITAEIAGEVKNPGVYELPLNSRINDLLITAGGLTDTAEVNWIGKYLNRASLLTDGQKVFIPSIVQQTKSSSANVEVYTQTISNANSSDSVVIIDINTASGELLESLPGIGQKYAQSIIEHRPYSNTEELVSKEVIGKNLFNKIKDKISVY